MMKTAELGLAQEWDKTFPKSEKVEHSKVTFINRYGITLAADMYVPKDAEGKLPAIAVSGPFGAVKEQSAGLYAQTMAERGYLTIAFDPSFTGESGGEPSIWRHPTSTPRTLWRRWIFFRSMNRSIPTASVSSESAAGAVWRSTRRRSIRASRRRLPQQCMI